MKLKDIHSDVWMGAILIILSVVFYMMTGSFNNPDAATWPRAILICIMILSAFLIIHGITLTQKKVGSDLIPGKLLKGSALALVAIVVYAIVMSFTGYFLSTAIFLPLGMFALGQRNWKAILGVTVGLEVFVYVLFVVQLQLRMP